MEYARSLLESPIHANDFLQVCIFFSGGLWSSNVMPASDAKANPWLDEGIDEVNRLATSAPIHKTNSKN